MPRPCVVVTMAAKRVQMRGRCGIVRDVVQNRQIVKGSLTAQPKRFTLETAMPPSALSEVLLVERSPVDGGVGRSSLSGLLHLT
jgi:hypothetical protein